MDFAELSLLLGYRTHVKKEHEAFGNKREAWSANWSHAREYFVHEGSVTEEHYEGMVYCCMVPTGAIVTERNGCIALQGNSLTENASSFTHVTIIGYDNDKIAVVYRKRFTGREAEPEFVVPEIEKLINKYRVHLIGADYGGGLDKNDTLIRRYGIEKVLRYQYCGAKKLFFDSEMMCWRVNRTECLMAMINAINRTNVFMFPAWETWEHTHAEDYLCLMMERDMKTQRAYIGKTAGKSDDGTHSLLYAFLASMVVYPRPDILQPDKEDPTKERSYR